jgi:hypothetical protein
VAVTFLDALFFSFVRLRFRTLWAPILAHGFSNTLGIVTFFLMDRPTGSGSRDITISGDTAAAHDFSPTSTHPPKTRSSSSSADRRRRVLAAMAARVAVHLPLPDSTQST